MVCNKLKINSSSIDINTELWQYQHFKMKAISSLKQEDEADVKVTLHIVLDSSMYIV